MACLGRHEDAIDHLTTARSLAPGNPDVLMNLANAFYASGRIEEALGNFRAVVFSRPDHPLANFGIGNCCFDLGRWNEALESYRIACRAMPGSYDINMSLGKAYASIGNLDAAIESYQRAVQLTASPSVALCDLASAMQLQGNLEQALECIEQSVKHQPGNAYARAEQASILYKAGRIKEARSLIRELVDNVPVFPHLVSVWGHLCQHSDECLEVVSLAESLLDDDNLAKQDVSNLHFTLGRLYDRAGEYDLAFEHYYQANTLILGDFDRRDHQAMIDCLMAAYNQDAISSLPRSTCQDQRPVFILGMPRSGTSLLEQILSSHPKVIGAGELGDIKNLAKEMFRGNEAVLSTRIKIADRKSLDNLSDRYLDTIGRLGGDAIRVTDKMPENFLWLGLILATATAGPGYSLPT